MPRDVALAVEAESEEFLKRRGALRQREEAIPDVSGRQDSIRLSEPPRASSVVGGRHDRGEAFII